MSVVFRVKGGLPVCRLFVRGLRADLDRSGFTSSPRSEEHGVQILDQCRDKCFLSGAEDVFCVLGLKQGRRETACTLYRLVADLRPAQDRSY